MAPTSGVVKGGETTENETDASEWGEQCLLNTLLFINIMHI
jgi:hypothetical protein